MACFSPIKAYKGPGGKLVFSPVEGFYDLPLQVVCGRCIGCRLERKRSWTIRAMHEAQMHSRNSFITLTYSNEHLPEDLSLDVRHWQLFAKKLRSRLGPFRFLHCGEYGDENLRPHYHALIFGHDFSADSVPFDAQTPGRSLRLSATLAELWPQGHHTIGPVNPKTAAYCAAYTVKKLNGDMAEKAYSRVRESTGECFSVKPEYATMSRRPGLGKSWFERYWRDVYPDNFVVMDGRKYKPPIFYDRLLEELDPDLHSRMIASRRAKIAGDNWNHTADRLEVRETVAQAKHRNTPDRPLHK